MENCNDVIAMIPNGRLYHRLSPAFWNNVYIYFERSETVNVFSDLW